MTTIPAGWKLVAKKTCYVLMHDEDVIATLAGPGSKENAAIIASMLAAPASPVSTVEQDPPAAYLTVDEEGSPCMLFFDVVEARTYCEVGEEPVPIYRRPAPAAGDALSNPALQKLFGDAITGALGFGAQGVNSPPKGHWLEPFWNMALADAAAGESRALLDHPLLRDVLGYIEDAGPADVWGAAQSWMSLRDAAIAAQRQGDA